MLIFGERQLRRVLAQYQAHDNGRRPHRSRHLHPPLPDHPAADLSPVRVNRRPILGGLLNEHERAAQKPRPTMVAEFWNPPRRLTLCLRDGLASPPGRTRSPATPVKCWGRPVAASTLPGLAAPGGH